MCKDYVKQIYEMSKEYDVRKVKIITNHIKIFGELCDCSDAKKDSDKLTLKNAKVWLMNDLCKCSDEDCQCSAPHVLSVDWLHVNIHKIVAFALVE